MHQYRKTALLFLAPFLTVFVAFYLAPVIYAVYLSLFIRKRAGQGRVWRPGKLHPGCARRRLPERS